jgi:hypothetical protein
MASNVFDRGAASVIFQIIGDHARLAIATLVAWGGNLEGAIVVVKGIAGCLAFRSDC